MHTPDQEVLEIGCPEADRRTVSTFLADPTQPHTTDELLVLAPLIGYLSQERALEIVADRDEDLMCAVWRDPGLEATVLEATLSGLGVTQTEDRSQALIAVAGWLPDAQWSAFDEAAVQDGFAFLPVYAEGDTWYAGPLRTGDVEKIAGYRDLRVRRLAASPCPAALEELWKSGCRPTAMPSQLAPMAAAIECGVAMLRGVFSGNGIVGQTLDAGSVLNRQFAFRPNGERRVHPVLPVPLHLRRELAGDAVTAR